MAFEPLLSALSPLWAMTNSLARVVAHANARRLPAPVISIGNIVAGGVGKTELTALIAARLVAQGKRVVVASRGYGSSWERQGAVAHDFATAAALKFPDEALVLLKKVPGVVVAVGADRGGVLLKHWEELLPDVVLLDDGYQHFALERNLDVLVHDFSVKWPVLRDLPIKLKKAGARVAMSEVPKAWEAARGESPWIKACYKLKATMDAQDREAALPSKAAVFCGIGNPLRFKRALETAGVKVVGFKTFRDHAGYDAPRARDVTAWHASLVERHGELPLLTTLKDYVKLVSVVESQGGVAGFEPRWVKIELVLGENENHLWTSVNESLVIRAT